MALIFLSHSSLDKGIARQLASDLKHYGHEVWLDEWQIKVGHCIPTAIEKGIQEADFIVLLLSTNAVQSNWVDREWKMAYWDEVNTNSIVVLPVLLEDCNIPKLIQTKKYADFRESYAIGFHELVGAIDWHSEAKGLITSYERSNFELPRVIRGSDELIILTLAQLQAKVNRMIDKLVGVKNAYVAQITGPVGKYVGFFLQDSTGAYLDCFVKQDTALEDLILTAPKGHFYGTIQEEPVSRAFIVSEWESAD